MALNTNLLAQTPDLAGSFVQGRQEARQNKLAEMQMMQQQQQFAQQQQDYEQTNAMNKYLQGANLNTPEGMAGLNQFGLKGVTTGATLAKNQADINAAKNKSQLDKLGIMEKTTDQAGSLYSAAQQNPAAWPQARQQLVAMMGQFGGDPNSIPEQYDPKFVALEMQKAVKVKDALADQRAAAGQAITMRGQNMVDARGKAANSIAAGQLALAQQKANREASMQPPVAIVDPVTGKQVYVTRNQAMGQTPAAAMESLPPKEIQKREASFPQATSSIKGFEAKSDNFIKDLIALRDDPGLENITGAIYGRTGSVTREGSRAQALYDKVVAKGGFQALQDMRDASKSGGALGNVSNQEGKQLQASVAAIDRRQNSADVKAALDQLISDIQGSKTRMREAYDTTYQYKSGGTSAPAAGNIDALLDKYK